MVRPIQSFTEGDHNAAHYSGAVRELPAASGHGFNVIPGLVLRVEDEHGFSRVVVVMQVKRFIEGERVHAMVRVPRTDVTDAIVFDFCDETEIIGSCVNHSDFDDEDCGFDVQMPSWSEAIHATGLAVPNNTTRVTR